MHKVKEREKFPELKRTQSKLVTTGKILRMQLNVKAKRKCKCRAVDLMVLMMRSSKMRGKTVVEALINNFSIVKALRVY